MSEVYVFICTKTTATPVLPLQAFDQMEQNRRVTNAFRAISGANLTVGDLKMRPNGNSIANHLLCDGTAVQRQAFPELFKFLGVVEGIGDGLTTFNLPNYLGTAIAVPADAPVQTITEGATISSGQPITEPVTPAEVGGTTGGNISTGGRVSRL